jgi:limonene-1,2-epoxide hydrolase
VGTTEAEQVVDRFIAACNRGDVDEILDYFTEDAVWHPLPMKPAVGKPALRESLSVWLRGAIGLRAEVHRQVSDGMIVMHERTDRFSLGDREMASPTAAVFEIDNGRITAWREYFDMSPFAGP